ncbi:MAG: hypothetical protein BWX84_00654 [Verrucomicrobia bacterium ADurb.Bin118]|nr:MAG: hypothetical protein BWX84_00654 [Verrucomicrobia bacterium ADurb.Bin118]
MQNQCCSGEQPIVSPKTGAVGKPERDIVTSPVVKLKGLSLGTE